MLKPQPQQINLKSASKSKKTIWSNLWEISKSRRTIIVGLIFALSVFYQIQNIQKIWPRYDSADYLTLSYNMVKYHIFSLDRHPKGKPLPTAYRMPGYPLFLAFVYRLTHWHIPDDVNSILHEKKTALTVATILIFELTLLMGGILLNKFTGTPWPGVLFLLILGFKSPYSIQLNYFFPEYLITAFLMLTSLCLYIAISIPRKRYFIFAGAACGALALTRAPFAYLPIFVVILLFFYWKRFGTMGQTIRYFLYFAISFLFLISPWLIRNQIQFNQPTLSGRGAGVLLTRLSMNNMTTEETWRGIFSWTRSPLARKQIASLSRHPEWRNRKAVRGMDPFFAHERKVKKYMESFQRRHPSYTATETEQALKKRAIAELRSHAYRNLIMSPVFAYRGIQQYHSLLLNLLLFAALLLGFIHAILTAQPEKAIFYLPAVYLFIFMSIFTFHLSRYSLPVVPITWIALLGFATKTITTAIKKRSYNKINIKRTVSASC